MRICEKEHLTRPSCNNPAENIPTASPRRRVARCLTAPPPSVGPTQKRETLCATFESVADLAAIKGEVSEKASGDDQPGKTSTCSPMRPAITSGSTSTRSGRPRVVRQDDRARFHDAGAAARLQHQMYTVTASACNQHGLNKVRFPAPVRSALASVPRVLWSTSRTWATAVQATVVDHRGGRGLGQTGVCGRERRSLHA